LTTDDVELHLLADLLKVRKEIDTFLGPIRRKSTCRWDPEELKDLPGQVSCQGCRTPVTPTYRVLVANGRCSCVSPNMQQLPKDGDVRGCFVAREGWVLLSCDYDTLELRTLAQACLDLIGESKLAEALRIPGMDVHCLMASNLTGIPYETLVKWRKEKTPEWEEKGDHARRLAKICNFGLGGHMGAEALKGNAHDEGVELTLEQCKGLIREWHKTWPEMSKFFAYCENQSGDGSEYGEVVQLRSNRIRANASLTERCNTYFSGLAGDGAKEALWEVCCECYLEDPWGDGPTALYGSRPCGFIHDEILVETPDDPDTLTAVGKRLGEVMCKVMQRWVPDVPITATAAAMRRWSKKADTVMVDGKLVCWEDRPKKAA
jgi:DNA polymerase I-like protein with 3'-5' exonuclease and polymerase domains